MRYQWAHIQKPAFDPKENYALWSFFFRRLNVIIIDLIYILIVSWLVSSQHTIKDRWIRKQINDLVSMKSPQRDLDPGFWA